MRKPLIATAVILIAGCLWSIRETARVAELRQQRSTLQQLAAGMGLAPRAMEDAARSHLPPHRKPGQADPLQLADEITALLADMKRFNEEGLAIDESIQKRIVTLLDAMLALDADDLRSLIDALKTHPAMDEQTRPAVLALTLTTLAGRQPLAALDVFTVSPELLDGNSPCRQALETALANLARDQPLAALEWIRSHAGTHPDLVTVESRRAVIAGAARQDFALALGLMNELGLDPADGEGLRRIAAVADTPEARTAFLTVLRAQAAAMGPETATRMLGEAMGAMAAGITQAGYDVAAAWLESTELSVGEIEPFIGKLRWQVTRDETGRWLEWIARRAGDGTSARQVTSSLVRDWTRNDYQAAGRWLAAARPGPLRDSAAIAYLETVAPYDPATAAQWAATLPPGQRTAAMQRIHDELHKSNPAAAADFAARHGIPPP